MSNAAATYRPCFTRDDMRVEVLHNPVDPGGYCPDHRVVFTFAPGLSESLTVHIDLIDCGDANFDTDISLVDGNADWASPLVMREVINLAVDEFYALGLDTRFGRLVGAAY